MSESSAEPEPVAAVGAATPSPSPQPQATLPQATLPQATPPQSTHVDSITMQSEQFNARIAQAKKNATAETEERHRAWLKERYGTDDQEQIDAWHAKQKELAEAEEKRKRDAMSERDRLQADLEAERKAAAAYKEQLAAAKRQAAYEKQTSAIKLIASTHVDSRYIDASAVLLAQHVRSLSAEERKTFGPEQVKKWYANLVKEQPAFGKEAVQPQKPKRQEPVTTGASPAETGPAQPKPVSSAEAAGKTLVPGKPNSMSDKEARDYMRQKGWHY